MSSVAEKNYSILTSVIFLSQGINVLYILNLITSGKISTSSFIIYILAVIIIAVIIYMIEKRLDSGLAPLLAKYNFLLSKIENNTSIKNNKLGFQFWLTIIINAIAIFAASMNIINHILNPEMLQGNWIDQHRTIILSILLGLMVLCFIAKIFVQKKLQIIRSQTDDLCQNIAKTDPKDVPENLIKDNQNPFENKINQNNNFDIATWSALLISAVITSIFGCAASKLLPNMPFYFYVAASFLIAVSVFWLIKINTNASIKKLNESEKYYAQMHNNNHEKIHAWLRKNNNSEKSMKNILHAYWGQLGDKERFEKSFGPRSRFFSFVFIPIFNFIAISIPIFFGLSTIFEIAKINIHIFIVIVISLILSAFYSKDKTNGHLADCKQMLFFEALMSMDNLKKANSEILNNQTELYRTQSSERNITTENKPLTATP